VYPEDIQPPKKRSGRKREKGEVTYWVVRKNNLGLETGIISELHPGEQEPQGQRKPTDAICYDLWRTSWIQPFKNMDVAGEYVVGRNNIGEIVHSRDPREPPVGAVIGGGIGGVVGGGLSARDSLTQAGMTGNELRGHMGNPIPSGNENLGEIVGWIDRRTAHGEIARSLPACTS
jgi:hypothetical protein